MIGLRPPFVRTDVLGHHVGRAVPRTEGDQAAGVATCPTQVQVIYRRPVVGAVIIGAPVTHLR